MENRKDCWYSIVRYNSGSLLGEFVNVGVIVHVLDEQVSTKYFLLEENNPKIKAISYSQTDINTYKSFKDLLEYYLEKSIENLLGAVGGLTIASPQDRNYLEGIFDYFKNKNLTLSRPKYAYTSNPEGLFEKIFETYVGRKYLQTERKSVSVKKYVKAVFEEKKLLNKKVAQDVPISPIASLSNIKINVDFGYKNGVWNYLQVLPNITSVAKNTEWFAKTKFMFENIERDTKLHLMYRSSEVDNKDEFNGMVSYLGTLAPNGIYRLDLDNQGEILKLCELIERDAHDLDKLKLA
ncbi:DUF3037 domain-containing protein [Priestia flexa]|uniref:DUF3037 domain-containing protein n=1 Tax=Priestia flexa TaxID=86664 RepID=UPI0009C2F346|nr:DUF3037 domain-containing protein [Priestia flexa]AQX53354.1 hypothetical protein BC359_02900 [Priestia flexa]